MKEKDYTNLFRDHETHYNQDDITGEGGFGVIQKICHVPPAVTKRKKDSQNNGSISQNQFDKNQAEERERFREEHKILKKLYHPNIVSYFGFFNYGDADFGIVMEYCSHGDARDLRHIRDSPKFVFSFDTIIYWSIQLFDALTYLHFHSIIHRDIKPSNIFVTKHFVMKLGDFDTCSKMVEAWPALGSPRYKSPEQQIENEDEEMKDSEKLSKTTWVHEKNDVYGMGLVIYELIQRERYCNDEDGETVHCARVKARMHCAVKPFVVPNCDDEQLKSIVEKCIHLLRSERYSAIEAFKALKALPLNSPYISVDTNVENVYLPNKFHVYDSEYQLIRPKVKDDVKIAQDQPKTTLENTVDFDFDFGDLTVDMGLNSAENSAIPSKQSKPIRKFFLGNDDERPLCFLKESDITKRANEAKEKYLKKRSLLSPKCLDQFNAKIPKIYKEKRLEHILFQGFDFHRGDDLVDETIENLYREHLHWYFYAQLHKHSVELIPENPTKDDYEMWERNVRRKTQ